MANICFSKIYTYTCEHSEKCARGLVANYVIEIILESPFNQIEIILKNSGLKKLSVLFGLPIQKDRDFVLYHSITNREAMLTVKGELGLRSILIFYKQLLKEKFWREYWLH